MTKHLIGREWMRCYPNRYGPPGVQYFGVALEVKWADLWIGAFWRRRPDSWDVWVCLVPCLPLHVYAYWWRRGDGR